MKLIFKWYDLWVGFFYDRKKNWLYFFPIPCLGIIFKLPIRRSVVEWVFKDNPYARPRMHAIVTRAEDGERIASFVEDKNPDKLAWSRRRWLKNPN